MKKAYTITPEQYRENIRIMDKARYQYGDLANAPERTRKKCTKAASENLKVERPEDRLFFENEAIYNLWLNRDTDEPITARELYTIVATLAQEIRNAASSVRVAYDYANCDEFV